MQNEYANINLCFTSPHNKISHLMAGVFKLVMLFYRGGGEGGREGGRGQGELPYVNYIGRNCGIGYGF